MELDHLAVAAETLDQAASHLVGALSVETQPGGRHERFGTHNRLIGLEDGLYLEAIAVEPEAPPLERPRWFDLDRLSGGARLQNWICRVPDLEAAVQNAPDGTGTIVEMARGDLRWRMAVPDNGVLPFDNMYPALIEWEGDQHPSTRLANSGLRLVQLIVSHPDATALGETLGDLSGDPRIVFQTGEPKLKASFETPDGTKWLT